MYFGSVYTEIICLNNKNMNIYDDECIFFLLHSFILLSSQCVNI